MKPILIDVDETDIVDGKLPVFDSWSASIHLGISLQTLGRYRKEKWVQHYSIGNTIIYLPSYLEKCRSIHPNQEKKDQNTDYVTLEIL